MGTHLRNHDQHGWKKSMMMKLLIVNYKKLVKVLSSEKLEMNKV